MDYFSSCFSITTYGYYCSYVSRRLLILSVFRTLSALSTFPDRTSSFRMQIVFVSSDVKSKQLSEKITSSSISNHTNGAKQSALICISIVPSFSVTEVSICGCKDPYAYMEQSFLPQYLSCHPAMYKLPLQTRGASLIRSHLQNLAPAHEYCSVPLLSSPQFPQIIH